MKRWLHNCIVVFLLLAYGCKEEPVPVPVTYDRTVLVYMVADNNLSGESDLNMQSIKIGALDKLNNNRLLVYNDRNNSAPQLIELYQEGKQIKVKIIKEYEEQNSASGSVLSMVIADAFPSQNSKSRGLVLWSHGTSWFPADKNLWWNDFNGSYSSKVTSDGLKRSFGEDDGDEMELSELREALPDSFFDFILFDACLMGSVEVAFELRNKTTYLLTSPTEIFAEGFPYEDIIGKIFANDGLEATLQSACDSYFSHYQSLGGEMKDVSVCLINTARLQELSVFCRQVVERQTAPVFNLNFDEIQAMYHRKDKSKLLFDFEDYYSRLSSPEEIKALHQLLDNIVIYKKNAPFIYSSTLAYSYPMNRYSGLSTYIPSSRFCELNGWYTTYTEWGRTLYMYGVSCE